MTHDEFNFAEWARTGIRFLDGGMGTQLQARGLQPGEIPEVWNVTRPEEIRAVHAAYAAAGADLVYANTFGANPVKYHGEIPLAEVIQAGVELARAVAPRVALDMGPTGRLLKPAGDFSFDEAFDAFAEQAVLGARAGADFAVIETMGDLRELKAAVLAVKENTTLPILATVALGENGTLLTGGDVAAVTVLLDSLRVDAMGFNCGLGPDLMRPYVEQMARLTRRPILVKPNAGLPKLENGRTVFTVSPDAFAEDVARLVAAGATLVGGCCGTTPAHLAAVHARLKDVPVPTRAQPEERTYVSSGTHAVEIPLDDTIVIGERINPTGKKKLKAALIEGDEGYVLREAVTQAEAGAQILDVNVGVPGLDETSVLARTVQAVQSVVDMPVQIDTADPQALEAALRCVNGKPLVNSVNGKEESLRAVLPLVARYGGAVVALALDESGIPETVEGRLAVVRKILARGAEYGLRPADFVVDVLCLAVSSDAQSARVVLEAVRRVREELGCRTVLGVSNISFGLPARPLLNSAFYTLAMGAGLSAAIINPLSRDMMTAYRAYRALTGLDRHCEAWIAQAPDVTSPASPPVDASASDVRQAIRRGLQEDAAAAVRAARADGRDALALVDGEIVPALEETGRAFEQGSLFLPQLLMAAEAARAAFETVREALPADAAAARGPILIATVKGDIHDIGKNIVRTLWENYGYRVIDLGRDVPPERIVEAVRREKVKLVGLSALMTTTVGAMAETIRQIRAADLPARVVVGGAVLTEAYARTIGADYYARDAMAAVRVAEEVFA